MVVKCLNQTLKLQKFCTIFFNYWNIKLFSLIQRYDSSNNVKQIFRIIPKTSRFKQVMFIVLYNGIDSDFTILQIQTWYEFVHTKIKIILWIRDGKFKFWNGTENLTKKYFLKTKSSKHLSQVIGSIACQFFLTFVLNQNLWNRICF